jgi:hypothetical protein
MGLLKQGQLFRMASVPPAARFVGNADPDPAGFRPNRIRELQAA